MKVCGGLAGLLRQGRAFVSELEVADIAQALPAAIWEAISDPERRSVLAALSLLDGAEDPDFDRLSRLAAAILHAPVALVSLVDIDRQWFKSSVGLDVKETVTSVSFCAHAIVDAEPVFIVPDATRDPRFAQNPLVVGPPFIRFYAGAPISVRGVRIGTLCVIAPEPREGLEADQVGQLVELAGLAGTLFELKDEARVRARTAAALVQEEWRHALTLEAGKVGSWVWDVRSGDIIANDILKDMYRLDPDAKVRARDIIRAVHHDDRRALATALREAVDGGQDYVGEYRIGATGRWLMARGRVFQRDADGKPLIIMGVNLDITDTKQTAENTRLLLRELNHRVKNTLAMIQSLARQTVRRNPDPAAFIEAFTGRLQTLSDAHRLLSDRDWTGIGLVELIQLQVSDAVPETARIELEGEDIQLPPDQALGLGIILHELVTNAVKHGALSVRRGKVRLSWTVGRRGDRRVTLLWEETGGPPVQKPDAYGLGARLIERSLAKVLDSEVDLRFPREGVTARISFPVDE